MTLNMLLTMDYQSVMYYNQWILIICMDTDTDGITDVITLL